MVCWSSIQLQHKRIQTPPTWCTRKGFISLYSDLTLSDILLHTITTQNGALLATSSNTARHGRRCHNEIRKIMQMQHLILLPKQQIREIQINRAVLALACGWWSSVGYPCCRGEKLAHKYIKFPAIGRRKVLHNQELPEPEANQGLRLPESAPPILVFFSKF